MTKRAERLSEALEEAALAGANEIREVLGTYRGKDPERLKRVQVAVGAVSGYTRWRASQNNMVSMMLMAARQTGVSASDTLLIAKSAGLLPETIEESPLKAVR
jgi:hypothetical protein